MWTAGLIYGLIEREQVHELLVREEVGSCLVRFSENHPGYFAIGYKRQDDDVAKSVRHYLVTNDDIGAKKSLADFIGESAQFKFIAQLTGQLTAEGQPRIKFVQKDLVLEPWYTKKQSLAVDGYDTALASNASSGGGSSADTSKPKNKRTRN